MIKSILMNEEKSALIRRTLTNLEKKRSGIKKIDKLVNKKIDRKFHLDLNELTPSELDFEMGRRARNLRENADPRIYLNLKPGRKKIVKVFMLIPFFLRMIFVKPVSLIRDFIFFNNAMIVRMRKTDSRLSDLENRINTSIGDKEMDAISGREIGD